MQEIHSKQKTQSNIVLSTIIGAVLAPQYSLREQEHRTIHMYSAILFFILSSVLVSLPKLCTGISLKGGDPAAPSGTATLLRLSPSHRFRLRRYHYRLRAPSAPMA